MIIKMGKFPSSLKANYTAKLIDYINGRGHPEGTVKFSGTRNILDPKNPTREFNNVIKSCRTYFTSPPIAHVIISFQEDEHPTKEQAAEAVKIYLKTQDISHNQVVWALHQNTKHDHIHLAINRISPLTLQPQRFNHGFYKRGNQLAARLIEQAQHWKSDRGNLTQTNPDGSITFKRNVDANVHALSSGACEFEARHDTPSIQSLAQKSALPILKSAKSWSELQDKLSAINFEVQPKGQGGILFYKPKNVAVKLSSISQACSFGKLQKRLGSFNHFKPLSPVEFNTLHLAGTFSAYPRTDNSSYSGQVVHIDTGRDLFIISNGKTSSQHQLSKLGISLKVNQFIKFAYSEGGQKITPELSQADNFLRGKIKL